MDGEVWWAVVHGVPDTTERLHFHFSLHALEKEMATHSSVLAWGERTMPRPPNLGTPDASEPRAWPMGPRRSRVLTV